MHDAVVTIRAARATDAPGIAEVHVRSWQAAYAGLISQEYLDGLDPEPRRRGWERFLSATDRPRSGVIVADVGGAVAGFVSFGPTRDQDRDPVSVGEVGAIYLLAEVWGQGIGRDLMRAALERLEADGFSHATLWVLDTNERARRFYEAGGWRPDGATKRDDSLGVALNEVRYSRLLRAGRAGSATR